MTNITKKYNRDLNLKIEWLKRILANERPNINSNKEVGALLIKIDRMLKDRNNLESTINIQRMKELYHHVHLNINNGG